MDIFDISLKCYFEDRRIYFYYFDGLCKIKKQKQKNVFELLDINENTYRANRLNPSKKSIIYINKLSNYFNVDILPIENEKELDQFVSGVLYAVYYKIHESMKIYLKKINKLLENDNNLSPVLLLIKIFIIINSGDTFSNIKSNCSYDIEKLKFFENSNYYQDEFQFLSRVILFCFGMYNDIEYLDKYSDVYPMLSWLYYNVRASLSFVEHKDINAIVYYYQALEIYKRTFNIERAISAINNLALQMNIIKEYSISLKELEKVIYYVYSLPLEGPANNISLHYVYAKYMQNQFDDIIIMYQRLINKLINPNPIMISMIMLSADKLNFKDLFNELYLRYKNKYIDAFLNYKETKSIEELAGIQMTDYVKGLINNLT